MIGRFINGSQSIICCQRRLTRYGHVTKQIFVIRQFVTPSRVYYMCARSHYIRNDD
jgi:hypothetical protein